MIPKKIHYCWLSGDPYPELIANCLESWKKHLPDYEWVLWDTNKFDIEQNKWVSQAFLNKKYAFAADFIRLYAVNKYGGIYLDTDVEVCRSFDPLLHLPYFIGSEGNGVIEAGVFGSQANMPWLKDCLSFYENIDFIKPDGSFNIQTLPSVMMKQIQKNNSIQEVSSIEELPLDYKGGKLFMLPPDYFCAKDHGTGKITKTKNTYCIHHFAMSWIPKSRTFLPNIKRKLMQVLGVGTVNFVIQTFGLRYLRKMINKK